MWAATTLFWMSDEWKVEPSPRVLPFCPLTYTSYEFIPLDLVRSEWAFARPPPRV